LSQACSPQFRALLLSMVALHPHFLAFLLFSDDQHPAHLCSLVPPCLRAPPSAAQVPALLILPHFPTKPFFP
jgi:hypothetical protein